MHLFLVQFSFPETQSDYVPRCAFQIRHLMLCSFFQNALMFANPTFSFFSSFFFLISFFGFQDLCWSRKTEEFVYQQKLKHVRVKQWVWLSRLLPAISIQNSHWTCEKRLCMGSEAQSLLGIINPKATAMVLDTWSATRIWPQWIHHMPQLWTATLWMCVLSKAKMGK